MTALVKIPGLFLISEIAMFSYKSQAPSSGELSRQLGVSHVLDGGVRKEGNRIRITAQLIEASTDILRDSYEQSTPPRELLAQAEARVFGILENKGGVNVASISFPGSSAETDSASDPSYPVCWT